MLALLADLSHPLVGSLLGTRYQQVHLLHPLVVSKPEQLASLQQRVDIGRIEQAGDRCIDRLIGPSRRLLVTASRGRDNLPPA